jgi:hypothetical protein
MLREGYKSRTVISITKMAFSGLQRGGGEWLTSSIFLDLAAELAI